MLEDIPVRGCGKSRGGIIHLGIRRCKGREVSPVTPKLIPGRNPFKEGRL